MIGARGTNRPIPSVERSGPIHRTDAMKRLARSILTAAIMLMPLFVAACEHSHIHLPR